MPAGRPPKPVELKKFEGTYRKDRDQKKEKTEKSLTLVPGMIIPKDEKVTCPKTLKTPYVRKYWKKLTNNLIQLQVLSYNDIPQLENIMIILEKLREAQEQFAACSLSEATEVVKFGVILDLVNKLTKMFNELASKYYISPSARSKLVLDVMTIEKTSQEIKKNATGLDAVLNLRNAN